MWLGAELKLYRSMLDCVVLSVQLAASTKYWWSHLEQGSKTRKVV